MKPLIISHKADPDGVTVIVLAKLVFQDFDYILADIEEVDTYVINNLDKYDFIYITDLNISEELANKIEQNYNNKVKVIDHHLSNINMNKYSFIDVVDMSDEKKESGTSLYYKYLLKNYNNELLNKDVTKTLVEHVRTMDTYDFSQTSKDEASKIEVLFKIYGKDKFIDKFYNVIVTSNELYSKEDLNLIKLENERIKRYIEEKTFIEISLDNKRVGVVFAERNISELGNYLINKYDYLDYIVLINVDKSISYRGKDKVDLSIIAKKYNGGGHFNAAGSPLPKNLKEIIIQEIFKEAIIMEEKNDSQNS